MSPRLRNFLIVTTILAGCAAYGLYSKFGDRRSAGGSATPGSDTRAPRAMKMTLGYDSFTPREIGQPVAGQPWVTDLEIVDLDGDGMLDILTCDGRLNSVSWLRQLPGRLFDEQVIGTSVAGPAHLEVADMNGDGHLDVLVSSMGVVPPSNDKIGSVVVMVNDGQNHFANRVLLKGVSRVNYVAAADFNKDGRPDLIAGQFGYMEGEIRWLENKGDWNFESHYLLDMPGAIQVPAGDLNGDGNLDAVGLVSQDSEEVHLFKGDGKGGFLNQVLYGSMNRDFGSSGITLADVDRDGKLDIVYTNGDGFDYATPGPRKWHGLQWLQNSGTGKFAYHRIGDFAGAYSPVVVDLNRDGFDDIVVSSGFNDWSKPEAISLGCFENDGHQNYTFRPLAHRPTHLVTVRAADLFHDGRIELVTGSFAFYPPFDSSARITLWTPVE